MPDEEGQASRVEITQAECESFCFLLRAVKGYKQGYGNTWFMMEKICRLFSVTPTADCPKGQVTRLGKTYGGDWRSSSVALAAQNKE